MSDVEPAGGGPDLISDRFVLGELRGSGGSASVFAAHDTASGEPVALKILHPHLSGLPERREAFFTEARAAVALEHLNIAAVRGMGVHDAGGLTMAWIAFELVAGGSLAERVEGGGPLRVSDTAALAAGMLAGLAAAHAAGLVHRDVSPGNVLLTTQPGEDIVPEHVRLIDFGLADAAGRPALGSDVLRTAAGAGGEPGSDGGIAAENGVIGSVQYMSPEQARGLPIDERGDLYAASAVLYFALTGQPPFPRQSSEAVMRAHVSAPPPVVSALRPGVPRELDRLLVRGLAKRPEQRFDSAAHMADAVRGALASIPGPDAATVVLAEAATTRFVASPPRAGYATSVPRPAGRVIAVSAVTAPSPRATRRLAGRTRGGGVALVVVAIAGALTLVLWGWAALATGRGEVATAASDPPVVPTVTMTPTVEPTVDSVRVPQLETLSLAEARAALEREGFRVGALNPESSLRAADTVLRSHPAGGEAVEAGSTVDLVIASGANTVPTVAGQAHGAAVAALESAGFAVKQELVPHPDARSGEIVGTQPAEGTSLRLGTTVTLLIAVLTPVEPTSTPVPTPTPTPTQPPG
ncbi:protein kinase domain-containing protein [Luethyella okanaganae]|uniref:non-specific serine/threonine protein kinase n=1 Tax=Luethyella okanaganae TaxID=69372 RepID=A0ABW1VGR6_9MICO